MSAWLSPRRRRWMAVAAVTMLGACGAEPTEERAGPASSAKIVELPAIEVRDLHADTDVALTSLLPSDRPVLLWFWAPH